MDNIHSDDTIRNNVVNGTTGGILNVSNDTICGSAMVNLNTTGRQGGIQWQRLVSGVFTDELNADSVSYSVVVDSTVSFRAVACGVNFSDTITVVALNIPSSPLTTNDTVMVTCGDSATAILTASTLLLGADFNWYSDSNSIVPIASGDTFLLGMYTTSQYYSDTLYVSVVDPINGCDSERSMATAIIQCTVGIDETA